MFAALSSSVFTQLCLGVCLGLGLAGSALLKVGFPRLKVGWHGLIQAAVAGVIYTLLTPVSSPTAVLSAILYLVGAFFATLVASPLFGRWVASGRVRIAVLAVSGFALVAAACYLHTQAENEDLAAFEKQLQLHQDVPKLVEELLPQIVTDQYQQVEILHAVDQFSQEQRIESERSIILHDRQYQLIQRETLSSKSNCHGWVFTAGRFWIRGNQVEAILRDNGYAVVKEPKPGDIAIYRDAGNAVSHTALVRYVSPNLPVLVESKWGCGSVFLHDVDASVYGKQFQYYRSPRSGHVLRGMETVPPLLNTQ